MTTHPFRRRVTLAALLTGLLVTTACSSDTPETGDGTAVADATDTSDVVGDDDVTEEPAAAESESTEPGDDEQTVSFTWVDGQAYELPGTCRSSPEETGSAGEFLSVVATGGPIEVDFFGFRAISDGGDDGIFGGFSQDGSSYSVTDAVADGPGPDFSVVVDVYEGRGSAGADPDYEITVTCTS
jgi:hypothetical protein